MKQEGYLFALSYQLDTGGKGKGFSVYTMNACRGEGAAVGPVTNVGTARRTVKNVNLRLMQGKVQWWVFMNTDEQKYRNLSRN